MINKYQTKYEMNLCVIITMEQKMKYNPMMDDCLFF